MEWLTSVRCRLFTLPYRDQALFFHREVFEDVGGFPDQPLMKDYALMRTLNRKGTLEMLAVSVRTSARRWARLGVWRTTALNQFIIVAYWLGVSPERLAGWYRSAGRRRRSGEDKLGE